MKLCRFKNLFEEHLVSLITEMGLTCIAVCGCRSWYNIFVLVVVLSGVADCAADVQEPIQKWIQELFLGGAIPDLGFQVSISYSILVNSNIHYFLSVQLQGVNCSCLFMKNHPRSWIFDGNFRRKRKFNKISIINISPVWRGFFRTNSIRAMSELCDIRQMGWFKHWSDFLLFTSSIFYKTIY